MENEMNADRWLPEKIRGPATDVGATNFVRSTQAHSGLWCSKLAQLRLTDRTEVDLCHADWVRNDPVLTTRGWLLCTTTQFLRELREACGSERASASIIDRPG
jgi:hypothetical protein